MYCIKNYKKKNNKKIIFGLTSAIIILFFCIILFSNVLMSDDVNKQFNIESNIQKAVNDVVGITSNNGEKSTWGSGVIVSKDGYILTNEHLLDKGSQCTVFLNQNQKIIAKKVWSNLENDLAIVKVDTKFDNCAVMIESDELKIGEDVYAVGNPVGSDFEKSVTKGIISGLNRNLEFEENMQKFYLSNLIQTDAGINFGNSGGALINNKGQLIGINTIKITSADSMGFAIPVDFIIPIVKKIEEKGSFAEPSLGLRGYDKYTISKLNLGLKLNKGVYIGEVNIGSEAEKNGIKIGDIITEIDGKSVENFLNLKKYVFEKNPGDIVTLKIKRDISEFNVMLKI